MYTESVFVQGHSSSPLRSAYAASASKKQIQILANWPAQKTDPNITQKSKKNGPVKKQIRYTYGTKPRFN